MRVKTTLNNWKGNEMKIRGKKVAGKTAFELGLIVEGQAKLLCPVQYGFLRASYTTASVSQSTDVEAVSAGDIPPGYKGVNIEKITAPSDPNEVLVGTSVDYGPPVEFGTVKMPAQPHLRPALDLARGKALSVVRVFGKWIFADYLRDPLEGI